MSRILIAALLSVPIQVSAQVPWMRTVDLRCAYHHQLKDQHGSPEHHFLLFYENDSVVQVIMADWEGAWQFDHRKSPVQLIEEFVDEFHCEPENFNINNGVTNSWFAGASMVWRDQYYDLAKFEQGGAMFIYGNQPFTRIKCWNRIVRPVKKFPKWSSGCLGDTIR